MCISTSGNVGIGTTSPTVNLEVKGTDSLVSPTIRVNHDLGIITSSIDIIADAATGGIINVSDNYNTVFKRGANESMRIDGGGRVGINTSSPKASAALDITSTTRGFLPPRMTDTEMNNISSPDQGLIVFNTTVNEICFFDGSTWVRLSPGGGGSSPIKLTSQTLTAASWTLVGDYYTYSFSNSNIDTTCDISVTPQNASYQTAYNANILPYVATASGTATFYAQFPPQADIVADIVITQTS
jgi:hypothetical protein